MNETNKNKLKELEEALSQMGSGLDAVDKTGSWSHFRKHEKRSQELIDALPTKIQKKLSSTHPSIHNWYHIQKEVQKLRK